MSEQKIIMRKFLSESDDAYVDVRVDNYNPERSHDPDDTLFRGWGGVELIIYDGYKQVDFACTLNRNGDGVTKEYDRGISELEAIKQACNAAMDELTDEMGRIEMDNLPDGPDES